MQPATPPKENIDNNTLKRIHICSMCSARGSVQECDMDEERAQSGIKRQRGGERRTL